MDQVRRVTNEVNAKSMRTLGITDRYACGETPNAVSFVDYESVGMEALGAWWRQMWQMPAASSSGVSVVRCAGTCAALACPLPATRRRATYHLLVQARGSSIAGL